MIVYADFPGLAGVFLEDSYVLAISELAGELTFRLDAVLTPEHPDYHPPQPGEQYCYAEGTLVFANVTQVEWIRRSNGYFTDASGEHDLGNVDSLTMDGNSYRAEGDWGEVRLAGGGTPRFEVTSDT